ncbi:MBL fold metallo-hydrolase [Patescibacteria group bacterium]|nr:MBL fold metallo-hydrolase [Patescibacteria group bacterium]
MRNLRNKIIFLGTGGGGSMVSLQKRSTAGFWANVEGINLYFDPGPGAMWHIRQAKLVPDDLQAILISHKHVDHATDLNALIESIHYQMTRGGWNYKDYKVFIPPDVYGLISEHHQKMPGQIIKVKAEREYKLKHLKITTTKNLIEKPYYKNRLDEFGYQVKGKKIDFLYLPETFYKKDLAGNIKSKLLILNMMKATGDYYLNTVKVIKELSPQLILLRHWVRRTLVYGVKKLVDKLQKDTKIKIIPLKDGDVFNLRTKTLES